MWIRLSSYQSNVVVGTCKAFYLHTCRVPPVKPHNEYYCQDCSALQQLYSSALGPFSDKWSHGVAAEHQHHISLTAVLLLID